jgi:hypothetical protein
LSFPFEVLGTIVAGFVLLGIAVTTVFYAIGILIDGDY